MAPLTQTNSTEEELERTQFIIKEFLVQSHHSELFETRIQKLIFYTEVYCILHYRRRLTNVEYRPYMYGAFSRDVRAALNSLDEVTRRKTVIQGNRTTGYSLSDHSSSLSDGIQNIIEKVCEYVSEESTEELAQFSKSSWLFENTEYDHPMNFPEFATALDAHPEAEEALLRQMPSRAEIDDAEDVLLPLTE
ncbi:hypothetical protein C5C07_20065 [Haloferax sp. Atlit-4N]|uniref:type II toxin-antitoxin system antitoxin SocA domain-containing protein n=1 Tax=Haloferax sp. Atlit-4N TaxID=2077206 RepID=UPI000E26E72C|nr:type II toxin-antitoxin system antitoxin SocA domain-containing protein [Haloferax sp. Atlit-4N]RDZ49814.1 hypothetical protein C5C07_20065 [Haloferax sp. Atlit-4N]